MKKNHFSLSFGKRLLPGMFAVPSHAVPKPDSNDFCLVVDHTAGNFAPNGQIQKCEIKGVKLDGICALGISLRAFPHDHPTSELVLWKADVAEAY